MQQKPRKYPELDKGDKVKILRKRDKLDKERVSNWSENSYSIDDIKTVLGQKHYYINGRVFLRHELLKV